MFNRSCSCATRVSVVAQTSRYIPLVRTTRLIQITPFSERRPSMCESVQQDDKQSWLRGQRTVNRHSSIPVYLPAQVPHQVDLDVASYGSTLTTIRLWTKASAKSQRVIQNHVVRQLLGSQFKTTFEEASSNAVC